MSRRISAAVAAASASRRAASSSTAQFVFNTAAKLAQRNRAGARADSAAYDYIRDEVARRLVLRLGDVTRAFPVAADLGANTGNLLKQLRAEEAPHDLASSLPVPGGIRELHMIEPAARMLFRDEALWRQPPQASAVAAHALVAPLEGAPLPFADSSLDLVLSSMAMHWVNDLPGLLHEVLRVLRPDGCFLFALAGGETLQELRTSFLAAELETAGGASPHASPMVMVADAGNLLTAAGFALATVDADVFTVQFPSPDTLYRHLRAMGESNAALEMRQGVRRRLLARAAELYVRDFGVSEADDGAAEAGVAVPATVQVIYGIGWKPAPEQPQPRKRGSVPSGFGQRKPPRMGTGPSDG